MKTLSLSEVKMKLSGLVEAVQATDEEIVAESAEGKESTALFPGGFVGRPWK